MKYRLTVAAAISLVGGALAVGAATQGDNGTLAKGLRVGGLDVGGLSPEEAAANIQSKIKIPQVTISAAGKTWTLPADSLGWKYDARAALDAAKTFSGERNIVERIQGILGSAKIQDFPVVATVDEAVAKDALAKLVAGAASQPKDATLGFDNASLKYKVLTQDSPGRRPDTESAARAYAASPDQTSLDIPVIEWEAKYTSKNLQELVDKGNLLMRPATVSMDGGSHKENLTALQMANFFWVKPEGIVFDEAAIKKSLKSLASSLSQPARNARFAWQGGSFVKVKESAGRTISEDKALAIFKKAIADQSIKSIVLPSELSNPTVLLANLPNPAKLQLITTGVSTYYGSSPERRSNVANAAAKIDGAVVGAGEVFSFLNNLGGITAANGFVSGKIISKGRTVDGIGGGVCQVSTTTFRAMYQAGLPLVERSQHSYRVGYYEPRVGFEAAVFDPSVDLKFKNDTGAPILVRTVNMRSRSRLLVQIWGTKPERTVYVSPATILSRTPHPPAKYVVNKSLGAGVVKQVDWAADGFNLYITRTIKDTAGTRTDRVSTVYKPWQAVFETGSGAAVAAQGSH